MAVLFDTIGLGITVANEDEERSITFTLKLYKGHLMFTLALI